MPIINIKDFFTAVEKRAEEINMFQGAPNLSTIDKAICEATVYFLNKVMSDEKADTEETTVYKLLERAYSRLIFYHEKSFNQTDYELIKEIEAFEIFGKHSNNNNNNLLTQ